MIADDLNRIRMYVSAPSKDTLLSIWAILNNDVKEEYFLLLSDNSNRKEVFNQILLIDPDYFKNKIDSIFAGRYTNVEFFAIRLLSKVTFDIQIKDNSLKDLLRLLNYFIKKSNKNAIVNDQVFWFISNSIINLPLNEITDTHLGFIYSKALRNNSSLLSNDIYKNLLPKIVNDKNSSLLFRLLNRVVFKLVSANNKLGSNFLSFFDSYHLAEMITEKSVIDFAELLGADFLLKFSYKRLKKAISMEPYYFSAFHFPSIEDTNQIRDKSTFEYSIVKFVRVQLENRTFDDELILNFFLKSKEPIFKRLGIHYIGIHYPSKKHLFWNWHGGNPLDFGVLKHEIFMLLAKNSANISDEEVSILFEWLHKIKLRKWNERVTKKELESSRAIEAKEYLVALMDTTGPLKSRIKAKKSEFDGINSYDREHPGFNSYFSSSSRYVNSDLTDEFKAYSHDSKLLVEKILSDEQKLNKSEVRGMMGGIQSIFSENPKLIQDVDVLLKLDISYLGDIIYGLERAWESKKEIDWVSALDLIWKVIIKDDFIADEKSKHFLGYCSWLIRAGTCDDSHAISGND
jgi:hypothetical protein